MRKSVGSLAIVLLITLSASASLAKGPSDGRHHAARADRSTSAKGHRRRGAIAVLMRRAAPPAPPPIHPDSVGSPNDGKLIGGVHLDTSRAELRIVPSHLSGDVRWGLPSLVSLVERAARGVAKRYPGSVLDIGDLSRKGGGEIARHHSHESGRDADLGFYVVDGKGKQIHAASFLKIDASLHATSVPGARFDAGRNWALVEMLVTDPHARVSHIFIAEPLRQVLLAQGRARGVSQGVLDRAAIAMMQPHNSLPHDDHMHVRISCPHDAKDRCIEVAKNAPTGRSRTAHARAQRHRPVLRTPAPAKHAAVPHHPAAVAAPAPPDEAAADSAEVKDALDETGTVKITD